MENESWSKENPCPFCGSIESKKLKCLCCEQIACEICVKAKKEVHERIFVKFLNDAIYNACLKYRSIDKISHSYLKGKGREIFVKDILEPLLSTPFKIAAGTIVDHLGNDLGESDLVIYDPRICNPIKVSEDFQIIPLESVLHIIEVKSTLTTQEIADSVSKFKRLVIKAQFLTITIKNEPFRRSLPPCSIFAYRSDVEYKDEIDRIMESSEKGGEHFLSFVCVLGKGTWVKDRVDSEKRYNWYFFEPDKSDSPSNRTLLYVRAYIVSLIRSLYSRSSELLIGFDSEGKCINDQSICYIYKEVPEKYYCPDFKHSKLIEKPSSDCDFLYGFKPFIEQQDQDQTKIEKKDQEMPNG